VENAPEPKKPEWKSFEQIVGVLEKCLVPGAEVKLDQKLPNLKTGHPEQCDVVILQGDAPRKTLTIVEVQKRGRKVLPNEFRGWLQKLENVGAQHLICVSEEGFPESIIDEVKFHGHKVRLMTLTELESNWPLQMVDNAMSYADMSHQVSAVKVTGEFPIQRTQDTDTTTGIFRRTGSDKLASLRDLSEELYAGIRDLHLLPEGEISREFEIKPGPEQSLEYVAEPAKSFCVRSIALTLRITKKVHLIPFKAAHYVQTEYKDALAYAYIAKGDINGAEVGAELIFLPYKDGLLKLVGMTVKHLPGKTSSHIALIHIPNSPSAKAADKTLPPLNP
jgi:hypothetical protein